MKVVTLYFIILILLLILFVCLITIFYILDSLFAAIKNKDKESILDILTKLITCLSLTTAILLFSFDKIEYINIDNIIYFIIFIFILLIYILFFNLVYKIVHYFINKSQNSEEF